MNASRVLIVPWISTSDNGSSMHFCKARRSGRAVGAIAECLTEHPLLGTGGPEVSRCAQYFERK